MVFHRSEQDHSHYWRPLISGKATNMAHIHPEEAQWPITSIPASDGVKLNTRHSSGARSRVLLRHRSPLLYINTRRRRFNSLSSRSVARLGPNPKQVRFCCHGSLLSCWRLDSRNRMFRCPIRCPFYRIWPFFLCFIFYCCSFYRESSDRLQPWGTSDFSFSRRICYVVHQFLR